jgi:hypothetical protein
MMPMRRAFAQAAGLRVHGSDRGMRAGEALRSRVVPANTGIAFMLPAPPQAAGH